MPFQRIPKISWADLNPGQIAGYGIVGDPAHAHLVLGSDGAGSNGLRLYGADGATVLVDLRADTGAASFRGDVQIGSTVPTDTLTGSALGGDNLQTRSRPGNYPDPLTNYPGVTHTVAGTFAGTPAWHVTIPAPASGTDYYKGIIHADAVHIQPGATYTASAWIYLGAATSVPVTIRVRATMLDAGHAYISEPYADVALSAAGWRRVTFTFTAPGTAVYAQFSTQFPYSPGAPQACDYYLYGFQLEPGAVATGYKPSPSEAGQNLLGGGTAYGDTTINGKLIVGNPAGAHAVLGTDANGADGLRLYAADGVTPLIDLNIAGTPTVTVRSGDSGNYWELTSNQQDNLLGHVAGETNAGSLRIETVPTAGKTYPLLRITSPRVNHLGVDTFISMTGLADDDVTGGFIQLEVDGDTLMELNDAAVNVNRALALTSGPLVGGFGLVRLYGGTGAPNNAYGVNGDFYLRGDGGAGQHLYVKAAGAWTGLV